MMGWKLRLDRRLERPFWLPVAVVVGSAVGGMGIASVLFLAKGLNPIAALYKILLGSFGSRFGIMETLTKAIPLMLTGTGLALAFKARFWNIGAEGQILAGAIGASWVALFASPYLPAQLVLPAMFFVGFAAGAAWALIPALLRLRWGVNEAISTLMLNYVIAELVQFLVYGPWRGTGQTGFPVTDDFPETAILPVLYGSRVHYPTVILAGIVVIVCWVLLAKTRFGFEVRVSGENPEAARYAGISAPRVIIGLMLLSGGLAGFAGVGEVAGIHQHLAYPWSISSGYGFTAIIVAWLGRLHPVGIVLASIFFGGLTVGGDVIQTSLRLPVATVNVFSAVILFCLIIGDVFLDFRIRLEREKR